jgi:hypothetical protein
MRSLPVIAFSALLCIPVAALAANDHSKWEQCTSDTDCVLTRGPCGEWEGVNKNYKPDYDADTAKISPDIECQAVYDRPDAAAKCLDNKCIVR